MPKRALRRRAAGPSLPRDFVVAHQRERMMCALAESAARYGYPACSVARITARAGVSRRTFFAQFRDVEDLFLSTCDYGAARLLGHVDRALAASRDGEAPLRRCLRALLAGLAFEPALTRLCVVEVLSAGPRAIAQRDRYQRAFAELLERVAAQERGQPAAPLAAEGLVGAIHDLVYKRVAQGRAGELPDLLDDLHSFAVAVLRLAPLGDPADQRAASP